MLYRDVIVVALWYNLFQTNLKLMMFTENSGNISIKYYLKYTNYSEPYESVSRYVEWVKTHTLAEFVSLLIDNMQEWQYNDSHRYPI